MVSAKNNNLLAQMDGSVLVKRLDDREKFKSVRSSAEQKVNPSRVPRISLI